MRVLLINTNRLQLPWPVVPAGLCQVAAVLEADGHQVRVLDLCFSRRPEAAVQSAVESFRPGLVGLGIRNIDNASGYNPQFLLDRIKKDVIAPLRAVFQGPIVIGGPAAGISGADLLHYYDLSLAVQGDGERTMGELARRLVVQSSLKGLKGLIIREKGRILEENPPWPVPDLDALPAIHYQRYINLKAYRRYGAPLPIQTKRGCPLTCVYCTYNRIEGPFYRLKSPQGVADEIERQVAETGMRRIEFTDSTFNIPLEHAKAVLRAVTGKGLKLNLRTMGLNPGAVDEELVDLMIQAGFKDVDLGAESLCDTTLKTLGKHYSKEDVLRTGRLLAKKKLPTSWMLLLGAPGETRETVTETIDTVERAASKQDLVVLGVGIRVYHGAPITRQMENPPSPANTNFLFPACYVPPGISPAEIRDLAWTARKKHDHFLVYTMDLSYPPLVLKIISRIMGLFVPEQPLWKAYIAYRRFERITGLPKWGQVIGRIKRRLHKGDGA